MHHAQHPLSGKTVLFRFGGKHTKRTLTSAELIDWIDRLEREIQGRDSLPAESVYMRRRDLDGLSDDDEIVLTMAYDHSNRLSLVAFHQREIVTYEGHPDFEKIIAEAT